MKRKLKSLGYLERRGTMAYTGKFVDNFNTVEEAANFVNAVNMLIDREYVVMNRK